MNIPLIAVLALVLTIFQLWRLRHRRTEDLCPVCKSALKLTIVGDNIIEEMSEECTKCNFLHEFAYGAYRTRIGGRIWEWAWDTDDAEVEQIGAEMYAAIKS